jgi:hypothetical protein
VRVADRRCTPTRPRGRFNREIGRRTDVVGIFPDDASPIRLVSMLAIEANDEWLVGRASYVFFYRFVGAPRDVSVGQASRNHAGNAAFAGGRRDDNGASKIGGSGWGGSCRGAVPTGASISAPVG